MTVINKNLIYLLLLFCAGLALTQVYIHRGKEGRLSVNQNEWCVDKPDIALISEKDGIHKKVDSDGMLEETQIIKNGKLFRQALFDPEGHILVERTFNVRGKMIACQ